MTRYWLMAALAAGFLAGCEAKSKFNPKEFSDEEKKKIAAEDKAVEDEESQGKMPKKGGKK
jgi:hypothetical protein